MKPKKKNITTYTLKKYEKKFISFLKKRGIYASYRKYLISPKVRKGIKDGHIPPNIFYLSFDWYETKEGRYFWGNISNEWFNICSNRRIIYSDVKDFYYNI